MTYWNAALLGLVQGLAEFLPISSSGHLAVLQNFLAIGDMENHMLFDVAAASGDAGSGHSRVLEGCARGCHRIPADAASAQNAARFEAQPARAAADQLSDSGDASR